MQLVISIDVSTAEPVCQLASESTWVIIRIQAATLEPALRDCKEITCTFGCPIAPHL